jgi:hypothetical protein
MALNDWANGVIGGTPLSADRLNERDGLLADALVQLARDPDALFSGSVVRDTNGAATSAQVQWPDGVAGTYSGTASTTWPGAINSYTITRASAPTLTFTQPMVTRNSDGAITNRPPITVS